MTATQPVNWIQLAAAATITLAVTGAAARTISRPLYQILLIICGLDVGARFWTTFSCVLMVVGPLFLVFLAASGSDGMADYVRRSVYLVSAGVVFAFLVMGYAVLRNAPGAAGASRPTAGRPAADQGAGETTLAEGRGQ